MIRTRRLRRRRRQHVLFGREASSQHPSRHLGDEAASEVGSVEQLHRALAPVHLPVPLTVVHWTLPQSRGV